VLSALEAVAPELAASGALPQVQDAGAEVLVLLGAAHLRLPGGGERALQCAAALRALGPAAAALPAVAFLAHAALLQLGRVQEADAALLGVVTHEDCAPVVAAAALRAALLAPGGAPGARAALGAAMDAAAGALNSVVARARARAAAGALGPARRKRPPCVEPAPQHNTTQHNTTLSPPLCSSPPSHPPSLPPLWLQTTRGWCWTWRRRC
jgi:hypothetical protein